MVVMLDNMAERYGQLPSQLLDSANTVDLYVLTQAMAFRNLPRDKDGKPIPPLPRLSQAELQTMLDGVRK